MINSAEIFEFAISCSQVHRYTVTLKAMEITTEIVTPEWKQDALTRYYYNIDSLHKVNHHIIIKDAHNDVVLEISSTFNWEYKCVLRKINGYADLLSNTTIYDIVLPEVEFKKRSESLQKLTIIKSVYQTEAMMFYYHDKQLKEHQETIKALQATIDTIKYQNKQLVETIDVLSRRVSGLEEEVQELQPEVFMTPLGQQVKDVSNVGTTTDTVVCTSVETQVQEPVEPRAQKQVETQVQEPVEPKKSSTENISSYVVENSSMVVVTTEPRKTTWYKIFGDY